MVRLSLIHICLIVGESLMGVILAFIIAASVTSGGSEAPLALALENWDNIGELLGLAVFIFGIFIFVSRVLRCLLYTSRCV